MTFKSAARLYPIGLLSGVAMILASLIPSLIFPGTPLLYKKITFFLGLILTGLGFLSNGITGIAFKQMQGKVGNFYTLEMKSRVSFSADVAMFVLLGIGILYLAAQLLLGALVIHF